MKITIKTPCKEELSKVEYHLKRFCIENYQEFELFIDEISKYKQERSKE